MDDIAVLFVCSSAEPDRSDGDFFMGILAGMLAKQVMRLSELSLDAGKTIYRQLFVASNRYADMKNDVDQILLKCGYQQIVSDRKADES